MTDEQVVAAATTQPIARSARRLLVLASVAAAVSNFGILFVAARSLDARHNEEFLVYWALLFGLFGVQSGIQNETTRATTAPSPTGASVSRTALIWGLLSATVVCGAGLLWVPALLPTSWGPAVAVLTVTALLYPAYVTLVGSLAGTQRWHRYGTTLLVEVSMRVALVLVAAAVGTGLIGLEIASAAAVLTLVLMLVFSARARSAFSSRADVNRSRLLRNGGLAMTSTACTALLVTGYPALVKVTNSAESLGMDAHDAAVLVGACILAVSLTRAPIMMPLMAFVGVAISAFARHSGGVIQAVRKPFLALAAVAAVGAVGAYLVGPWFLRLFKPEYVLPGWYFAALTAASALMAWLTILGALALATRRHGLYVAGWSVASLVAVACLLLPLPLLTTTVLSVSLGPLIGCAVLLLALLRRGAEDPSPSAGVGGPSPAA